MADTNIGTLRNATVLMRTIASAVLVTFTTVTLSPSVHAMQQHAVRQETLKQVAADERGNLDQQLTKVKEQLRLLADKSGTATGNPLTAQQRRAAKEAIHAWRAEYRTLKAKIQSELDSTGQLLERKRLSDVIKRRHAETVARIQSMSTSVETDIDATLAATDDATIKVKAQAAFEQLERAQLRRPQQGFDPKNLPNSSLKANPDRKPKLTSEAFQAALLASDVSIRLAQAGGFDLSRLPGASDPLLLAATTEVTMTSDIRTKAEELNRSPVEIYNWVRNHIHWQPTWGAIQDASHTLSARRGNAFDIASLTIALLRASGIPARYVYGTVDVPEDKFRNWAGGFQDIGAAMDFASAGGIPVAAVTSAGRITRIRLEHVWVEVAVDFQPSRGVKNLIADSWIPVDPSFKQHEFLTGVDAVQIAGIDPALVAQTLVASGVVNENDSSVSGFDAAILQNAQAQARTAIEDHLDDLSDATVGDVLGGKRIVALAVPLLSASLPNRVVVAGSRFAAIPSVLQQQITFAFGRDFLGEPIDPATFPWARLNNRNVTLSFRPAAQADRDAIAALIPEGEITDYRQLLTAIPAYLISVVPELRLNGTVLVSGMPMRLGEDLLFVFDPHFVTAGVKPFSYHLPAGSYLSVAVFGGSISPREVELNALQLKQVQQAVQAPGNLAAESLTRDELLGYQYRGALLDYYGLYQLNSEILIEKQGGYFAMAAGLGTFGYEPEVDTFFGVPRTLRPGSSVFNVPIVNIVGTSAGDFGLNRSITMGIGMLSSALEHAVPEQLDPGTPAISAAKALQTATLEGRQIIGADRSNVEAALSRSTLDSAAQAEVRAAVAAGKAAVLHTGAISIPGWSGSGYVIFDPVTGSGAYKITGGQNGGVQQVADGITLAAAGASGYLDTTVGRYAGRDFWLSERLKYLSKMGNAASALGYVGFGISALMIWTDTTLSTSEKILRTCTEMLFFGVTAYITGSLAAAIAAPIGAVALPLVLGVALSVAVTLAMTYALLAINLIYFARAGRAREAYRWA